MQIKTSNFFQKSTDTKPVIVIPIQNQKFEWVEEVKKHMDESSKDPEYPVIYLTSASTDSGILGLVNCLKQEPGGHKIRGIFLNQSKPMPLNFKTPSPLLKTILELSLIQNVVNEEGVLGSYRHHPLKEADSSAPTTVEVEHAYINTQMRGDLSSLKWIEGSLKYYLPERHPHSELCTVNYAPLNFRDIMLGKAEINLFGL